MKIAILSLLYIFQTISYAVDPQVTQMYNNYASCTKEFNVQGKYR